MAHKNNSCWHQLKMKFSLYYSVATDSFQSLLGLQIKLNGSKTTLEDEELKVLTAHDNLQVYLHRIDVETINNKLKKINIPLYTTHVLYILQKITNKSVLPTSQCLQTYKLLRR